MIGLDFIHCQIRCFSFKFLAHYNFDGFEEQKKSHHVKNVVNLQDISHLIFSLIFNLILWILINLISLCEGRWARKYQVHYCICMGWESNPVVSCDGRRIRFHKINYGNSRILYKVRAACHPYGFILLWQFDMTNPLGLDTLWSPKSAWYLA